MEASNALLKWLNKSLFTVKAQVWKTGKSTTTRFNTPKIREKSFLEIKVIEPILTPVSHVHRTPQEFPTENLDNISDEKKTTQPIQYSPQKTSSNPNYQQKDQENFPQEDLLIT